MSDDEYNDLFQYEYLFYNIVFEGGGSKGMAYCGAIQVSRSRLLHYDITVSFSARL